MVIISNLQTLSDFSKEEEEQSNKLQEQRLKLEPLDSQLEILRYEKESYIAEIEQCRQYGYLILVQMLFSFIL